MTGKPVAYETAAVKPHASSKSDCQGGPKAEKIEWSHSHKGSSDHQRPNLCLLRLCALCGKMGNDPKSKIKWYSENNHFKDMNRIDGMPMEFEWKIFPGITTLGLLEKIQSLMRDLQCEPEHFKDRIIFMSITNDIEW